MRWYIICKIIYVDIEIYQCLIRIINGKGYNKQCVAILQKIMSEAEVDIAKDKLRKLLVKRLDETGLRQTIKLQVHDLVHDKGMEKINIEDIVQELVPKASSMISEEVKNDLMNEAKQSLKESDYL